ncbi:MAG TPA: GNAT family N-acetyltransferase [Smithellaceae bacterium]|jgi:acetyltransferase|nr:GNAT family N-acetyltransferase [Smithella sp.]HNZ11680.1 GNAT family N-acetyltransferase [Smithellaceae bacterium]HOG82409.1 GNAT family N-acetyltransferase [Smithellaceae bacterium]HOQ41480.1 GNAT family N-acetyltransferase [Smithellaceae bacterium]HPL66243.1 GNAT family N-acetyltransferase [Smithellaceae bacterium]
MDMLPAENHIYPVQYESRLTLKNGKEVLIRPVTYTDESLIVDLSRRLSAESLYLRFLRPVSALSKDFLFQLTHLDYDKNFALAAVIRENGKDAIIGVARYGYDPDNRITDFAVSVRDDWQRCGLGKSLLLKIFAIGREHGITRFVSIIDSTNHMMKNALRNLGYEVKYSYENGSTQVEVLV